MLEEPVHTCPDADHHSQALVPFPHDDGGQDLPPEQAVLDARSEGVEALMAQHSQLIVEGAATHRELEQGHKSRVAKSSWNRAAQEVANVKQQEHRRQELWAARLALSAWALECSGVGGVLLGIEGGYEDDQGLQL